jgi:hypothetical protein
MSIIQIEELINQARAFVNERDNKQGNNRNSNQSSDKEALTVVTLQQFLNSSLPAREVILAPWLTTQSLNMIYSWRGIGKTHVALGIAYAVASGGKFLEWQAPKPRGVLYLDGEMPSNALQERLATIYRSQPREFPEDNFLLLTPDLQKSSMPDLATIDGQEQVNELIRPDTELIIVDNLSCLMRSGGRENDAESWLRVGEWALAKRVQGKSVLFIHHAGKSGNQRGTSKREDILDTVISLKHPDDYKPDQGAHFEVHFEKAREFFGKSAKPFIAQLVPSLIGQEWIITSKVSDSMKEQIIFLHKAGVHTNDIANKLNINRSTVFRYLKEHKVSEGSPKIDQETNLQ